MIFWSSDHPLLMTLDSVTGLFIPRSSSNESLMFQEQEVVMMHEVLGGQKDKLRHEDLLLSRNLHLQSSCVPDPIICEDGLQERACQTEHGTPEDMKVGLIRRKTLLCQTEHGTLEGLKLRSPFRICSGISLSSGEAPSGPGSALGSASSGAELQRHQGCVCGNKE
ncbi:hypothetical protein NQZ68_032877 [Dissostichus eleginoides]|nr:hypothetical protein NQZ68_032877 [Dissostichus eleginoides]